MKCERCGKEVDTLVRVDEESGWEYVCESCAMDMNPVEVLVPPPDGDVFINQNGACIMSIKTLRMGVDADKIASAYIKLKEKTV